MAAETSNHHLGVVKQFCRWMVKNARRATADPVSHLAKQNAKTDQRRVRRALTADEQRRLIQAAADGPDGAGMSGPERALLYRLALETGLRQSELRSLQRASFALETDPPMVMVAAAYSKHRDDDTLALKLATADALREHLRGMLPACIPQLRSAWRGIARSP